MVPTGAGSIYETVRFLGVYVCNSNVVDEYCEWMDYETIEGKCKTSRTRQDQPLIEGVDGWVEYRKDTHTHTVILDFQSMI